MDQSQCCKLPYKVDSCQLVDKRRPFSVLHNNAITIQSRELRERDKVVNYENDQNVSSKTSANEHTRMLQNMLVLLNASKTSANVGSSLESGHEEEFEEQEYVKPELCIEKIYSYFTGTDVNFSTNPVLVRDIYIHMKETEHELRKLFRKSTNKISIKMRTAFIDWFVYTTERFKFNTETLHLAVRYADEYLFKEEFGVEDLMLVGTCAVFLACKKEEARDNIPDIDELVVHAKSAYTKYEILNMEQKMLRALDFKLSYPTSYQFLQMFCDIVNIKDEVSFLAQYLCDVALMYEEICYCTEPSRIAAASLVLSNHLLYNQPRQPDIEILSAYNQSDLKITTTLLFAKFDEIQATDFRFVKSKYSTLEYKSVSKKSYPRTMHF